jgi:putative membrane protein
MTVPLAPRVTNDPRDYLAAERTFLAWIRTGLALMGFGFVVARFGLFLRELQLTQPGAPVQSYGFSLWFGTALIVLGVFVNIFSLWHHISLVHDLNRGGESFTRPSSLAIVVALILALVGVAMAIYLVSVRGSRQLLPQIPQQKSMLSSPERGTIRKLVKLSQNPSFESKEESNG